MVAIRTAAPADIPALLRLQEACYPLLSMVSAWREGHLQAHLDAFPEGQFVATAGGEVVGHCATFRTTRERALTPHTFRDITAGGTFQSHDPQGDVLYGAEMMVHPDHRRRGVARLLYKARFGLVRRLGLACFVAGGRIPGYEDAADRMTPQQYVAEVAASHRSDRVLTPQLRSGLQARGVLPGYLCDPRSLDNACLLVWENPEASANATGAARGPRAP